jgi:CheY-like chemotaxis protein
MVVEENFLTLDEANLDGAKLISAYTYFGDKLYSFIDKKEIPKVLIVEDDAISITLVKSMLKDEYCEIQSASNGEEGLLMLNMAHNENKPFDIVFTDHNMPKLSGEEMLKKYLKSTDDKKLVTVSISGDVNGKDKDFEFDYYATKPFKKSEIVTIYHHSILNNKKSVINKGEKQNAKTAA